MIGNVLTWDTYEIPMNDEQIELLEENEAVLFTDWDGQEARYVLSGLWIDSCLAIGANPLEACAIVLDHNRETL